MLHTAVEPDVSYDYINALYYQTRKNRSIGCDKERLRKHLALKAVDSDGVLSSLFGNGLVEEAGQSVLLTTDGWHYILGKRRGKSHASICFTGVTELSHEREASVYRFDYITRDNTLRQSTHTLSVSITHDLSRKWGMRDFGASENKPALINVLRRYAFDFIAQRLIDSNLDVHEKLQLGPERLAQSCRYQADNLPGVEAWEYEVEWTMFSRS